MNEKQKARITDLIRMNANRTDWLAFICLKNAFSLDACAYPKDGKIFLIFRKYGHFNSRKFRQIATLQARQFFGVHDLIRSPIIRKAWDKTPYCEYQFSVG